MNSADFPEVAAAGPVASRRALAASLISAANLNGLAAILFSLSLGSIPGAFLFAAIVLLGIANKLDALRGAHWTQRNLFLLKPEVTATVSMLAAGLNALTALATLYIYQANVTALQPWFPQHFNDHSLQLVLAFAWSMGAAGDYALRLSDRRRFSGIGLRGATAFKLAISNPCFWYCFASMSTSLLGLYFKNSQPDRLQYMLVGAATLVSLVALIYALASVYAEKRGKPMRETGFINLVSAITPLLAAVQLWLGGFQGPALLLFCAHFLCIAANLLIWFEIRQGYLRGQP